MPHIGGVQHESVAMVHHIGVQHDGAVIAEAKLLDDKAVDTANEVRKFPFGQASALEDRDISNPVAHQASFVLCRVLEKSDHRNNISDSESTPRGRKSVVTVRHIGIQHDGDAIAEAKLLEDNEILKLTFGEASASGDQNIGDPVAQQMKPLTDADWDARTNDVLSTQQLVAILEEDFLELDDLKCPLDGIN
ncbi:hypothetical protein Pfo_021992 [Paulownia fortunei]|nr:hypothetical protein Pfo_021992 [Paulownia fortunei]